MKRARIRLTKEAVRQAREAAAWWIENRPAAPSLFREELAALLSLLRTAPEAGAPHAHRRIKGVRRAPLPTSRYLVYYVVDRESGEVLVLAVWSALRGRPPQLSLE
ncbi:type II toxin-antitoxin system RelE/ParE family toxin [Sorangium atrum]|uniref:Type II toxin-antitoxin system RelE/ParE family toxin n=1 Tax=Sorangium atrum TaxID=2995308 RepID=A0ABT5C9Y8_9BACT|nr:type II toxin-antitoxin system RelE/ParE family toxin [Sorangium aterium]MDC0682589.1 type II toxin-antitoxin system RelE/ParE family toxin [Sorangium aterium]